MTKSSIAQWDKSHGAQYKADPSYRHFSGLQSVSTDFVTPSRGLQSVG
jgi:hypothetical protein